MATARAPEVPDANRAAGPDRPHDDFRLHQPQRGMLPNLLVVDPFRPRRPEMIRPTRGGISRKRFWIPAHTAFGRSHIVRVVRAASPDAAARGPSRATSSCDCGPPSTSSPRPWRSSGPTKAPSSRTQRRVGAGAERDRRAASCALRASSYLDSASRRFDSSSAASLATRLRARHGSWPSRPRLRRREKAGERGLGPRSSQSAPRNGGPR